MSNVIEIQTRSVEREPSFDAFYCLYPRKIAKKEAIKAWHRLSAKQQEKALEAIHTHIRYWNACETGKEFIPYPATWLNGWRFEDEIEEPQPKKRDDWTATDATICAKAAELGIWSQGMDKFTLIRAIRERMAT